MKPADITLQQLGGSRRLGVMIGAKDFMSDNDGRTLIFKFMRTPSANAIRITLNGMDTYDIEFIKIGRRNPKTYETPVTTTSEHKNIYAEDLHSLFERVTGLALTI